MSFGKIGERASCKGPGCNASLVFGSPIWIQEGKGVWPIGTVLCVRCATEGAPRDQLLEKRHAAGEELNAKEQARLAALQQEEPERRHRAELWRRLAAKQDLARRQLYGSDESEMNREARLRKNSVEALDLDDRAFLARRGVPPKGKSSEAERPAPPMPKVKADEVARPPTQRGTKHGGP